MPRKSKTSTRREELEQELADSVERLFCIDSEIAELRREERTMERSKRQIEEELRGLNDAKA